MTSVDVVGPDRAPPLEEEQLPGGVQGSIVAFVGVPSFVVTLAGFLIWQGVILNKLEHRGTIII